MVVLGSVHMFSDQYLDKEENAKVQVSCFYFFLDKQLGVESLTIITRQQQSGICVGAGF